MAARLTDRWSAQAVRPRQRMTDMARKPRMAPTTMKTVPSGREEICMNGASAVGGTVGATILNAPARVGRPVRAPPSVFVPPPVIEIGGTDPVGAADPEPVIFAVGDGPLELAPPVVLVPLVLSLLAVSADLDCACDCNASERFGSLESCAYVENAKNERATAESSGNRENFIVMV